MQTFDIKVGDGKHVCDTSTGLVLGGLYLCLVRYKKLEAEDPQKEAPPLGHKFSSSHDKPNRHLISLLLLLIVILGSAMRIYGLSYKSMWGDEILSVIWYRGKSIPEIARVSALRDVHPPLYYIILHFFLYFGDSEFVARLPSVIFGVLSIWLIYKVGRSFFGEREGLISAFLLSISTMHIHFSQEARMYTLYMFLSLLSLFLFYEAIKENDIKLWIGFVVSTILGLYTHFYMLLVPLIEMPFFVFMLYKNRSSIITSVRRVGRKKNLLLVLIFTISFICLLPLLPRVFHLLEGRALSTPWGLKAETFFVVLFRRFSVDWYGFSAGWYGLFLFLTTFLVGLFTSIREYRHPTAFLLLWVFLPSMLVFILTLRAGQPVAADKYLIFILPGYLVGISRGISSIASGLSKRFGSLSKPFAERKQVLAGFMVAVVVFGGVSVIPLQHYYRSEKTNWRAAAEYLGTNSHAGDSIIALGGRTEFLSYYYDENSQNTTLVSIHPAATEKLFASNLSSVEAGLWFVTPSKPYPFADPVEREPFIEEFKNWLTHNHFAEINRFVGIYTTLVILYRPKGLILVSIGVRFEQYDDSAAFNVHLPTDANYTIAIRAISNNESTLELVVDGVSKSFRTFIAEKWSYIELGTFFLKSESSKVMIINRSEPDVKVVLDKVAIWPTG